MKKTNQKEIDYRTLATEFSVLLEHDIDNKIIDVNINQKHRIIDIVLGLLSNKIEHRIVEDEAYPSENCKALIDISLLSKGES